MSNENEVNEKAWKFLTPEDQGEINAFLTSTAKPFLGHYLDTASPVPLLYHYTTGDNLIRIIQDQELWATQASCLNDTTELTYAAAQLRLRVMKRSSDTTDRRIRTFRSRLTEDLLNPYPELSGTFVTCFTETRDDLSQWRSYSGGEGGYAIQFDPKKLLLSGVSQPLLAKGWFQPLVQVAYKLEDEFVDDLLAFGERCFVELQGASLAPNDAVWLDEFTTYWLNQLSFFAACIKHPKFESEKEWRFVYSLRPEDVSEKRMKFRQRQYMMTRHVPLRLTTPLPITGVVVGPCRHPELSEIAVRDLLKANSYDLSAVKVERTEVPYRATSV